MNEGVNTPASPLHMYEKLKGTKLAAERSFAAIVRPWTYTDANFSRKSQKRRRRRREVEK